ncbi:MAG TPA: M1 family aminopeptidase [Gemmataceae bacterium]|nr:M1 family aminopeptidase [Gemmataceae bacterium]
MLRARFTRWVCLALVALGGISLRAHAGGVPDWIPTYDLDIRLEVEQHVAHVRERVTWINYHQRPADILVFNAHSHYKMPDKQLGFLAKSAEILRMSPSEAMDVEGQACQVHKAALLMPVPDKAAGTSTTRVELPFRFRDDNPTALEVRLPHEVHLGESVTVELEIEMRLPQKMGRWGQWKGITFLSNWSPVLAFYDDAPCGWHPTPFVPWHQPFFNEAGMYTVHVTLPCDQRVGCTGSIVSTQDLGDGWQRVEITTAAPVRDFALLCSNRFCEFAGQAGPVKVRCLALPEHGYYARYMVRSACEAISVYSRWFGPYPYPEFTIVESFFGWNGNECATLIMIDARIFEAPHLADHYVDYLISHETCHQWWYNVVGTNGYRETWMDEGLATYFGYRLMAQKYGKNDPLLHWPRGLEWMPNIPRETYHYCGLYGTLGRGEETSTIGALTDFGHIVNLFSMTYDKGSKVVGMIENRLGTERFFAFMQDVYVRYQFRILRVADFEHELTAFTGQSWEVFFKRWLYGKGLTDWAVEKVRVQGRKSKDSGSKPVHVTVLLKQKAEYNEQTVLGIALDDSGSYQVRIPILPEVPSMVLEDPPARVKVLPDNCVRVEVELPCEPTQITVDPDQVLVDRNPSNNYWKAPIRWRFTPFYTQLEETDLTTAYDRWNFTAGPWLYGSAYEDPWYTRSTRLGLRAGVYRTQEFDAGVYAAYRPDERDMLAGVDAVWSHFPWPNTQVGLNMETGLTETYWNKEADRGVLYGRYIFNYSSSLYLPPMHYVELFGAIQDNRLPPPRETIAGADPFNHETTTGVHYHIDYLTPYWDPEAGFRYDATFASGLPILGEQRAFERVETQFSIVKGMPGDFGWFSQTRLAGRIYAAAGFPNDGLYFPLGGSTLFRGYDLSQRQGSAVWVASAEWRLPLARDLRWDVCDHLVGLRAIWAVPFYDAGAAYLKNQIVGNVAQDVGLGLRFDLAWFSFVERTVLRVDMAKAVNDNTPMQFWIGVQHPF